LQLFGAELAYGTLTSLTTCNPRPVILTASPPNLPRMDDLAARVRLLESRYGIRCSALDAPDLDGILEDEDAITDSARAKMETVLPVSHLVAKKSQKSQMAYKPSTSSVSDGKVAELTGMEFPEYQGHKAQDLCDEELCLVPWKLVTKYPESFIGKTNRPKVSWS